MHFRVLLLGKLMVIAGAGVLAAVVAGSSVTADWPVITWVLAGACFVVGLGSYLARAWRRSLILLDDDGITMYALGARHTWPYEHLESVKRIGNWHVQLCFGAPSPGEPHEHIGSELLRPTAFVEGVLDWFAYTQGRELRGGDGQQLAA